jgi:hypothetical protein
MGAMIATPAFHACNETFGWRTTLSGLATVLVACGIAAALLARHSGARLVAPKSSGETQPGTLGPTFFKLSATFFLAASAGLMVLSQAREIVASYGGAAALAVAATTGLTGAIALARISGGWLVDRFAVPHVMCAAHALALGGGLLITLLPAPSPPSWDWAWSGWATASSPAPPPAGSASTGGPPTTAASPGAPTSPGAWLPSACRSWPATCST